MDTQSDTQFFSEPPEIYSGDKDFVSLNAWKAARTVRNFMYKKVVPVLPKTEEYNLENQIQRAAVSITANIAEGYGRYHYQEAIQFYRISRGSLYELKDHLITCFDLEYLTKSYLMEGVELIESAKRQLNGYINFVKKQKI